MNNEKKTIIIAIVAILIIAIGASYAFFTAGISSEDTTTIRTDAGIMKVNYEGGASINLSGIYPRDEVWATKNITVTGNNTTDAKMYYKLTLIIDSNTFLTSDPLQYELTSTNTSSNGEIIPIVSKTNLTRTTIELGNGYFNKSNNARHTYQLKIYYPKTAKEQNANQGKAFSAHVEIASVKEGEPVAFSTIILSSNEVKAPITTPGDVISESNEAILASAEDDYGTSYYFRGAVTNNYVEFANKCWRIVRIGGDNTVKLILHNDNISNVYNPCSSVNNNSAAAFAHYNGSTYTGAFNSMYEDNAYIGYMYGTPGSSTYEETHANVNKSTILTSLEEWYNNNLKAYESVIGDNVFCNDKGVDFGLGYGDYSTRYAANLRLYTNKIPSLKCSGELSKITSKIGLITADELVFAGFSFKGSSQNVFLSENVSGSWWSLTPFYYVGGTGSPARVASVKSRPSIFVIDDSSSFAWISSEELAGIRPYISILMNAKVTGNGTSEDPYKIA